MTTKPKVELNSPYQPVGNSAPRPKEVLEGTIWEVRGDSTRWPTLRGAWLNDDTMTELDKRVSAGVIFGRVKYNTRLNQNAPMTPEDKSNPDRDCPRHPTEQAVFFEAELRLPSLEPPHKSLSTYFLVWIGNYYRGSVIHIAPSYPQVLYFDPKKVEQKAGVLYRRVADIMYSHRKSLPVDREVAEFIASYTDKIAIPRSLKRPQY